MKMKLKKRFLVGGVVLTAAALVFSGAFAWISGVQQTSNQFVLEDYNVKLHDMLAGTPVEDGGAQQVKWTPGEAVDKDIWVSNDGSDDILVRVKLSETLKMRKGPETLLDVANVTHGSEEGPQIHEHVSWTTGNVKTYAEWQELPQDEQRGAFWVLADDGYAYWMQPLTPSGDEDTAGALGNTGLLVDAVTLAECSSGAIEYTIDVEMDAIDAKLAGLEEDGATWTSDAAKALATAAIYDPIASEIERLEQEIANPPSEDKAFSTAYVKQKQNAVEEYKAAQAAATPEEKQAHLTNARWYDLYAETQIVGGDYVYLPALRNGPEAIGKVTNRVVPGDKADEDCDVQLVMVKPGVEIKELTANFSKYETTHLDPTSRQYTVTSLADGVFQGVEVTNLKLESWQSHPELLNKHTFDGMTVKTVVMFNAEDDFIDAVKAGAYGTFANEPNYKNFA